MGRYFLMVSAVVLLWQTPGMASEVEILVRMLVEKGVLQQTEAEEILQQTRVESERARLETIEATRDALLTGADAPFIAGALPAWIRKTSLRGDFRVRYQFTDREGQPARHRGRYRLRLGCVTQINDKIDIGFGLCSAGANPKSTNQDMRRTFETPDIRLDYAYASYQAFDWLRLIGGKFQNPIWTPGGSYLWDSDIRPEGVSAVLNHTVGIFELFMISGFWVLDERANTSRDPFMLVFQPGCKMELGKNAYFKSALSWYEFTHVKGTQLDYTTGSNTRDLNGNLAKDFGVVVVSGELGYKTGFDMIPFTAVYGEYVKNRTTGTRNSGYGYGVRFGHQRVTKKHQWQAGLHYHRLQRDAWLDTFPDADAYGGQTNMQTYLLQFSHGLMDNINFTVNFFHSRPLSGRRLSEVNLHVEVNVRF